MVSLTAACPGAGAATCGAAGALEGAVVVAVAVEAGAGGPEGRRKRTPRTITAAAATAPTTRSFSGLPCGAGCAAETCVPTPVSELDDGTAGAPAIEVSPEGVGVIRCL